MLKIADSAFDLVRSDFRMPGMNGLELLRRIRTGQTPRPKDSRFIILTSFPNTEALGAVMSLDVNGFLVKSIRIGVVMEKIERAIQENFQLWARRKTMNQWLPICEVWKKRSGGADAVMEARMPAAEKIKFGTQKRVPLMQAREGMRVAADLVAKVGAKLILAGNRTHRVIY